MQNEELEVMGKIAALLQPLDGPARSRVLEWVRGALNVEALAGGGVPSRAVKPASQEDQKYSTFAELFHAADPKTEKEKALIAAYWTHKYSGVDQFGSQQINTELKHIGYRATNITDALSQLISERPNLVIQLTKSGTSKQARKTYKITDAGIRRVQEMLAQHGE